MLYYGRLRDWFGRCAGLKPVLAAVCFCFGYSASLQADTIFGNMTGNFSGGETVDGTAFDGLSLAEAFTPQANFLMTGVQVVVSSVGGTGDPNFDLYLYSNGGGAPVSLLTTLGTDLVAPASGGIVAVSVNGRVALVPGTEYWLVLTAFNANTDISWEAGGTQSVPTALTVPQLDGSWVANNSADLQFEVDGTDPPNAPEPGTFVLIAIPVAWITFRLARRRRGSA